jgi:hypothetical protein
MKIVVLLLLSVALVLSTLGCQSEAERQAELNKAQKTFNDQVAVFNHQMDEKYFGTLIELVGQDQGESVGMRLLLDCQQRGYQVHMGIDGHPDVGDASNASPPLSNRIKAECDDIINRESRIQSRRRAREAPEEKRKDAAYDKAHSARESK